MAENKKKTSLRESLRLHGRAFKLLNRYCPGRFLAIGLSAAVSAVIPYVTVFFSARVIGELAGERRPEMLLRWVLAAVLVGALLSLAKGALEHWKNAKQEYGYFQRDRLMRDKLLNMDFARIDRQETHDLLAQLRQNENWSANGLARISYFFEAAVQGTVGILSAAVLVVGLFTSKVPEGPLAVLDHPLAYPLLFLAVALPAGGASLLMGKGLSYYKDAAATAEATFGNRVYSGFGFLAEDRTRALDIRMYRQNVIARHYMNANRVFGVGGPMHKKSSGLPGILISVSQGMPGLLTGAVYVYVCLKAWAGAFGVGAVTQYVAAATALADNMNVLLEMLAEIRSNTYFLELTFKFLDMPNDMYQGSLTTEKRADRQYDVEFRDVSFKYPGSDSWALRHVSVKFQVGRRLAVVGENGSGKTTFIKLLCRLYDPQEGQILLNGIDIRKYNYRDYMDVFSVVFQDFQLLSQPLGANVAGSADYDKERVLKSLTDAGFDGRLAELPGGLDTQLYRDFDEGGVMISGGEAQKIAIARALYKDAPFIILDEPTAALDPMAEAEIYAQFNEISGDKTAVYISHRLSSCRFCDEILVFHDGHIVQQGSHDGLLGDEGGKYHQLWHAQAQYYDQ